MLWFGNYAALAPLQAADGPVDVSHLKTQFEHNSVIPNTFQPKKIIAAQASRNLNFKSPAGCSLKVGARVVRVLIETLDD